MSLFAKFYTPDSRARSAAIQSETHINAYERTQEQRANAARGKKGERKKAARPGKKEAFLCRMLNANYCKTFPPP